MRYIRPGSNNDGYKGQTFNSRASCGFFCKYIEENEPVGCFNINMSSYRYRKSHCGEKTFWRPSYLHIEISYTGKGTSLYQIRAQAITGRHKLTWWCKIRRSKRLSKLHFTDNLSSNSVCLVAIIKLGTFAEDCVRWIVWHTREEGLLWVVFHAWCRMPKVLWFRISGSIWKSSGAVWLFN